MLKSSQQFSGAVNAGANVNAIALTVEWRWFLFSEWMSLSMSLPKFTDAGTIWRTQRKLGNGKDVKRTFIFRFSFISVSERLRRKWPE
ncbi:hypothetical protein CEXT_318531 [Caerostris extrusa]|uniref:Uncharacterized protein n=1 Tax=Caerostris extrusa TaxID=172846 RepID=A0AAV4UXZ7_CAEEX|nr:hypothetical protein CEXT_318531 [Caerostris extrusa]